MTVLRPFDDVELAGALTAQPGWSRHVANAAFERARRLDVDPMEVLAGTDPDDGELPYREAARLLGVRHLTDIRRYLVPFDSRIDIDRLAGLRSARGRIDDQEVLFVVPGFSHIKALAARIAEDPSLRERLCVVSASTLEGGLAAVNADLLATNAVQRLARRYPLASAHLDLPLAVRATFIVALVVIIAISMIPALFIQPFFLAVVSLILVAPSVFRLWAAFTLGQNKPLVPQTLLGDDQLPIYTVLIPLRNEAHMVPQIARAMRGLDYPAEKLDVKFIVESVSPQTVAAVRALLGDKRFSLIVVPRRRPYTKPKALNFALPLARGEHVVVFDAEDLPDPGQLRAAASLFAADGTLECLQGELVIANASRRWISRMFAAEYAGHFGVLLPAIGRARFPVPLGGTSNHFRTETLREIGAWDAFNVTEDADLGIRMARLGLRVESVATTTLEEAPESLGNWVNQRTRWIKGWMQTLIVHSARPGRLLADLGWANLIAFYVFVGGMVLSLAIHGLFLTTTLATLAYEILTTGAPGVWTLVGLGALLLGYCGAGAISVIGLDRIGRSDLIASLAGLPLYWLLAWYAVMCACVELITRPYHWAKTTHKGLDTASPEPHPARPVRETRTV